MTPAHTVRSLPHRRLFWLFAAVSSALLVGGWLFFERQSAHVRREAAEQLEAVARLKIESIGQWRRNWMNDARWVGEAAFMRGKAQLYFARPDDATLRAEMIVWLDSWREIRGYQRVLLVGADLKVALASPTLAAGEGLDPEDEVTVREAFRSRRITVRDLHRHGATGPVSLGYAVPIVPGGAGDRGATVSGVLMFHLDAFEFLFPQIQTWPTPSRTAESLLVRREGDAVLFLNELRHQSGTALKLRHPLAAAERPAAQAVLGTEGVTEGVDYRGVRVLAAVGAIPNSPWFLVAKQDLAEINGPVRQWAWVVGGVTALLVLAAALGVGLLWRDREARFTRQELTERTQAKAALRESKERLDQALAAARMGSWYYHISEKRRQFDEQTLRLLGIDSAKFAGTAEEFYARVHPEDRPVIQAALARTIEQGVPYEVEFRTVWAEGSVHHLASRGRLERDAGGRPLQINGLMWDITARIATEEAVRDKETQLRALYAAMTEMLVVHEVVTDAAGVAVDYRILDCNPAFEQSTGIPRERAVGALASVVYGASPPPYLETYARVAATGEPTRFEVFFPPLRKHFDIAVVSPQRGRFATVTSDITARKEAEAALHESRQRLALHIEQTPLAVIGWDPEFRVREWNPAAEAIFGYTPEEARGQHASFIVPRQFWENVDGVMAALLANRGGTRSTNENVTKSGSSLVCEWFNTPLVDPDGIVIGVASLGMDITARTRMEAERARLTTELEQKNDELESILYFAAHDLRSPLVNLQGFGLRLEKACAELLARQPAPAAPPTPADDPPLADRVSKALRYIRASVDRMDTLISGLLQVARLGRVTVNPRAVDMNVLVRGLLRAMAIQIEAARAEMQLTALPPCHGDPQLLSQVFANLIDNALKYRDPARPLRITISGRTEGAAIVYCVADTGGGIAPAHQPKIWEMFHRLHPEGPVAGDGLGLKIVRRIVDRHHGRVWVESTPGEGTRFLVSLPTV